MSYSVTLKVANLTGGATSDIVLEVHPEWAPIGEE